MFKVFCFSFVLLFALSNNVWATKPDDIIFWGDVKAEMLGTQIVSEQTDKGSSVKIKAKKAWNIQLPFLRSRLISYIMLWWTT